MCSGVVWLGPAVFWTSHGPSLLRYARAMNVRSSHSDSRTARFAFAATSALASGLFSRGRQWLFLALLTCLLIVVGVLTYSSVESAVKTNLAEQLRTILNADVAAMEFWLSAQRANAMVLANDERVRDEIQALDSIANQSEGASKTAGLVSSRELKGVREKIDDWLETHKVPGFLLIRRDGLILAGDNDYGIGDPDLAQPFMPILEPIFDGETLVIPPLKSKLVLPDIDGTQRAGIPVMFIAAPVTSDDGKTIAALCLRVRPEEEFTKILSVARAGETGETYAFNRDGVLLTNSRFDEELKDFGLLTDDDKTRSLLNIELRDPGVDMTRGLRPTLRRSSQPLTRMAVSAIAGESGVDVDSYRDYRGVPVVGAWTWLPEYAIGVVTEVDAAEAFRPLNALRRAFAVLAGFLLLTTIALAALAMYASRLELTARRSAIEARRLGQYALDDKLGAGGMGVVYRAHHNMLHRPTAVKLLHAENTNEQAIARFEREVQLTSHLTHPNTIAIYDYGRTPEGVFYYAMEYLDGISLDDVVSRFGRLPQERVVHILQQLCGSLSEAHAMGLIHRDVKPANIMLTKCGGMRDFVKLLDFGLVKSQEVQREVTLAGSLIGTPLYMSPEAIARKEQDGRSDLYAVGAVGYYLLTGGPVFNGNTILELCRQHTEQTPTSPSQRAGVVVNHDVEQLIMQCLAKRPEDRPATAEVLEDQFAACTVAATWTRESAKQWWDENLSGETPSPNDLPQTLAPSPQSLQKTAALMETVEHVPDEES